MSDVDLARFFFSGMLKERSQGEVLARKDVESGELFGRVNQCVHGDQAGGHACYCGNPDSDYRKCRFGWYSNNELPDIECEWFAPNPDWVQGEDYYHSQRLTFEKLAKDGAVVYGKENEEIGWGAWTRTDEEGNPV